MTSPDLILRGLQVVGSDRRRSDVVVSRGVFSRVGVATSSSDDPTSGGEVEFSDAIASPGLVNSHDHLEFNLYPALGHRHYADYLEWGEDIHARDAGTIAAIEAVPRHLRLEWGALKNLVSGVTTVAHHAGSRDESALDRLPIACVRRGTSIHSVRRGGYWRWRLNAPRAREPYVFHVAEGTSEAVQVEADELADWNVFGRQLVAVHAVAMTGAQAAHFRAVVWCPLSNEFLFGTTANIARLVRRTAILFGTDSTLTADWNFWVHLRRARSTGLLSDEELFASVTSTAADVWGLPHAGRIEVGAQANLVVARKRREDRWDAFFAVDPEDLLLVLHGGTVLLVDASVKGVEVAEPRTRIRVNGHDKWIAGAAGPLFDSLGALGIEPNMPVSVA